MHVSNSTIQNSASLSGWKEIVLMIVFFFFSSRRRHTRCSRDWSSDVCSSDLGLYWANDLRDVLLRYGWPTWWTREPPMASLFVTEPNITGHDPSPAFQFTPGARAFDNPGDTKSEDWTPEPLQGRERYAPRYAKTFAYLDHQIGVFRRGDSCVVGAADDLSKDTALARRPARAAPVLTRSERRVVGRDHEDRHEHPHVPLGTKPRSRQGLS